MSKISPLPCNPETVPRYIAYRANTPPDLDGRLLSDCWQHAPRSSRFVDLVDGGKTIHDTRAAVLWDEQCLYVGYWIEEPDVQARMTERDSLIYEENDVELFIAGEDGYYEFEINALGTIYEVFFLWQDNYQEKGYDKLPEFNRSAEGVREFDGVGFKHPRGKRLGFWNWDYPGLKSAVWVDGTLNNNSDRDRGWRVELALPWAGLKHLAGSRHLPPQPGDVWRMDFSRFNQYKQAPPSTDSSGWAWSAHYAWDSHIPECFVAIEFNEQLVNSLT